MMNRSKSSRCAAFFLIWAALLGTRSLADCGTPTPVETKEAELRTLLPGSTPTQRLRIHARAPGKDNQALFVLYSLAFPETGGAYVYFAGVSTGSEPHLLFVYDISHYLPKFAVRHVQDPHHKFNALPQPPATVIIDACLDTFVLKPAAQAIHMNLFAKSARDHEEVASDVIFVLPDYGFVSPLLELNESSKVVDAASHRMEQDSIVAILPSRDEATDVIWKQYTTQSGGVLAPSYVQNRQYHWDGKRFQIKGTLEDDELETSLRDGVPLTRSDKIKRVRFEMSRPGPNDPAP